MTGSALPRLWLSLPPAVRRNWRAILVVAAMAVLWAIAAVALIRGSGAGPAAPVPTVEQRLQAKAAAMSATQIRNIAPDSAVAINAAIPVVDGSNPAAAPFRLAGGPADRARSLDCLTAAIYYEAATEPTEGQRAVAQVILNRVRHPAYPHSICGVVFEGARRATGCQFSFACDGSLRRAPMAGHWERARAVAEAALNGHVYAPVGWALNYHANYVVPYWSSSLVKSANVGLHIFYRWRGGLGRPAAFIAAYAGAEPAIAWRGGFGQPLRSEVQMAAGARDAAAAQAAAAATGTASSASVDSFQRAVLRRYEPLQRDTANALIAERAGTDASLSTSQRWSLTGRSGGTQQAPLGRRQEGRAQPPAELQGVRYRSDPAPAPAPPAAGGGGETATQATAR
jgi:spore germination cell wall hydrolase CwlJ-like protein